MTIHDAVDRFNITHYFDKVKGEWKPFDKNSVSIHFDWDFERLPNEPGLIVWVATRPDMPQVSVFYARAINQCRQTITGESEQSWNSNYAESDDQ